MTASVQGNLLVDQAVDHVDRDRLASLTIDLTNIPSPTGEEGVIARAYLDMLSDAGLIATLQAIGDVLRQKATKRNLSLKIFNFQPSEASAGNKVIQKVILKKAH